MTTSRLAKIIGWVAAFLVYAQGAIQSQSALPTNLAGWAHLLGAIAVGAAVHFASNTDGVK